MWGSVCVYVGGGMFEGLCMWVYVCLWGGDLCMWGVCL